MKRIVGGIKGGFLKWQFVKIVSEVLLTNLTFPSFTFDIWRHRRWRRRRKQFGTVYEWRKSRCFVFIGAMGIILQTKSAMQHCCGSEKENEKKNCSWSSSQWDKCKKNNTDETRKWAKVESEEDVCEMKWYSFFLLMRNKIEYFMITIRVSE